jgi:hypothetical protein
VSEPKQLIVMVHETVAQCLMRDAITFVTLVGSIGTGVLLDSSAMQWIAGIIWVVWLISRSLGQANVLRKTPQEAADWLRDKFGARASGALILALLAAPAVAEQGKPELSFCTDLPTLSERLHAHFGEQTAAEGIASGGKERLVIWANPDTGTWTAAVVRTSRIACLTGSGSGWEAAKTKGEEQGS